MLKKVTLFFLLNASLLLGFVTLKNLEVNEDFSLRQEARRKASLALANYPHRELGPSLTQEAVRKLEDWHQSYAKDLNLPLRWESHFKKAIEQESFAGPRSVALLNKLEEEVEGMQSLTAMPNWSTLNEESQQMMKVLNSSELTFQSEQLTEHLNNYISIVLKSRLSTQNKELALERAASVEKALVNFQDTQEGLKLEQTWLNTFLSLPQKLDSKSAYLMTEKKNDFFFWGQAFLYVIFFVLNFLLLWEWGRPSRSSLSDENNKTSTALDGLLCSRKAIEKTLMKSKKILQGREPHFQVREWESHNVLFTNRMRDSLAEVFAEIASHKGLKTKLSLAAGDEKQNVTCQIECSYLSSINKEDSSFFDSLSFKVKKLSDALKPYKGELDWECLYNESGPYEICLTVELPSTPV